MVFHDMNVPDQNAAHILPIFARRVFPDLKVDELFKTLQNIIANDPSIIDLSPLERGNESENARCLLQYIAYLRDILETMYMMFSVQWVDTMELHLIHTAYSGFQTM